MRRWVILGSLACVALACGGHTVNLGVGGDGGASGDDAGGSSGSSGGSSGSSPLSGTYTGYIESFKFPDGSDTVVMTLTFATDGAVTGTVFLGGAAPLAPPTDPNVGYPPGYLETFPPDQSISTLEGFAFTALGGSFTAPRVTLGLDPNELWKQWCQLQTVYPKYNGETDGGCGPLIGYGCLPNFDSSSQSNSSCSWSSCTEPTSMSVDCGKFGLCGFMGPNPCTCTATACTVPAPASPGVTFDMQLDAGALDGSESGIGGSVLNVHLVKGP